MRRDDGSILPLTIFYGVLALLLVLVVVAATSLYLERKRLFTVADGSALVGAEAFDLDQVTVESDEPDPHLQSADVASAVSAFLADNARTGFTDLTVVHADSIDGRTARVELAAEWKPPVVALLLPDGVRIDVTSTARSVFG